MQAGQLDLQFVGYKSYWNYAEKKGYSGTAIYTSMSRRVCCTACVQSSVTMSTSMSTKAA